MKPPFRPHAPAAQFSRAAALPLAPASLLAPARLSATTPRLAKALSLAAALALPTAPLAAETTTSTLTLVIKPAPPAPDAQINYIDVSETIPSPDAPTGAPLLILPLVFNNVESVAKKLADFSITDAQGSVPVTTEDDPDNNPAGTRRWLTARPTHGTLQVHYRAPIDNAPQVRGSGPPFGLRTETSAFSGIGRAFIVLPTTSRPYKISLHWNLADLGPHATAMSSFGDGNIELPPGPVTRVSDSYFMAGYLNRYPGDRLQAGSFAAAWTGSPPFDATQLMVWTGKLNTWYTRFFGGDPSRPYRVFLRSNTVNPGGGVELPNSFVATFDTSTRVDDLQLTLAHEMLHTWGPRLQPEGFPTQWFTEGTAVFYQRILPLRAGLLSPARFLDDLNKSAARYYTNTLIGAPNDQIGLHFWENTLIRVLPYDRGSFYFAVVNAQIRRASGGKRSLDDLILELVRRARGDAAPLDGAGWVDLLAKDVGPLAQSTYESMLAGAVMVPDSNAFGPCFERTTAPFRRFELGFEGKSLVSSPRIVTGLVAGSAAAKAGLRDGDEIVYPVGLDVIQSDQHATVTFQVRRNGTVSPITYLPRGATADAYQWKRVAGIPADKCGI